MTSIFQTACLFIINNFKCNNFNYSLIKLSINYCFVCPEGKSTLAVMFQNWSLEDGMR